MKEQKKLLIGASIVLAVAVLFGALFNTSVNANSTKIYESFEIFSSAYHNIKTYFYNVKKLESRQLMYGAIKGMLKSLNDDHSAFLEPKDLKSLNEETTGEFGGLGIMIGIRDKKLTIISPIYGTPAWKHHIQAGDVIVKINGKTTENITLREAVRKLRGKVGTTVKISLARKGHDQIIDVAIVRDVIKIESVKTEYLKKQKIGYIKITQFAGNTASLLKDALKKSLSNKKTKALIIDLRNNPGGLLSAAINTADLFLTEGLIVYTKGRYSSDVSRYFARQLGTYVDDDLPILILVNKGSASASEIFAGALQDTKRAFLLGTKTFGKGSVQRILPMQDGSAMKLTVALYYTPSGKQLKKNGLVPDFKVKIPDYSKDEQRSVLRLINDNHLSKFISRHGKNYTEKQVDTFTRQLQKLGIKLSRHEIGRWLHWEAGKIGMPEIVNLKYDIQLKKAVDLINAGKIKTRKLKIYTEAK